MASKIEIDKYFEAICHLIIEWRKRIELDDLELVDRSLPLRVTEMAKKYNLDYTDALKLYTIKNGRYSSLHYESEPGVWEPALIFITADKNLSSAAESERIRVWNCTAGLAKEWV